MNERQINPVIIHEQTKSRIKEVLRQPTMEELIQRNLEIIRFSPETAAQLWALRILESNKDPLTGLYNRRGLEERFNLCKGFLELPSEDKSEYSLSLVLLDLDYLKKINDDPKMGHDVGDLYLVGASECIKRCIGENDTAARVGGDEFAVLLFTRSGEDVQNIAKNIIEQFKQRKKELNLPEYTGFCIGIASEKGATLNELIKNADKRMYEAKRTKNYIR